MALHIFRQLVRSAGLCMKMAIWGYFVSVLDSPGEPAVPPREVSSAVLGGSGTELEVGRATSEGEVFGAMKVAPMEISSSL